MNVVVKDHTSLALNNSTLMSNEVSAQARTSMLNIIINMPIANDVLTLRKHTLDGVYTVATKSIAISFSPRSFSQKFSLTLSQ